jgi:deoxyribodipyrimidine photolyase-like uncharacterized protein
MRHFGEALKSAGITVHRAEFAHDPQLDADATFVERLVRELEQHPAEHLSVAVRRPKRSAL